MVLLGDDTHRQALGINKRIPETPYLYSRPDRDKIFQPLIDALSETKQYGHFKRDIKLVFTPEPPTVKTTQQSRPIDTPSTKVKVDARKKSAIKRGTFYAKPTPKSRDYKHFQIILSRRDMMALIIEYSDTEDYIEHVETNPTRKRWMKAFQYIYKNWELWGKYRANPNQHRNFSKVLFGPDMLDYKSDEVKKKKAFREGKHREMSDFIIECYEIPVSEFSKSEQIELF